MRVVFMGFQDWGYESLQALVDSDHELPLVVTHPQSDHPYESIWASSVSDRAEQAGIRCVEAKRFNQAWMLDLLRDIAPDVIVASDWRTILSNDVLAIPRLGGINLHDALLPRYGGFAPINWAIARGETEVGVTAHFMTEDVDLGDIIVQEPINVTEEMTATDAVRRVFALIGPMTLEALNRAADSSFQPTPQDPTQASFFRKRRDSDIQIDWNSSRRAVYNLIRAQSDPYPNAFGDLNGQRFRIKRASLARGHFEGRAGEVRHCSEQGTVVICGVPGDRGGSSKGDVFAGDAENGVILKALTFADGEELDPAELFARPHLALAASGEQRLNEAVGR